MKVVLIALIALLVLGGGGGGAYFYFQQPAEAYAGHGEEAVEAEKSHKAKGHGEAEYVELEPLILPVMDQYGVSHMLSLVVVIEVNDKDNAKMVENLAPKLKDAYIQDMYGVLYAKTIMKNGVLHVAKIKDRLNGISQKVLGHGIAQDVLIQVVQQRPI